MEGLIGTCKKTPLRQRGLRKICRVHKVINSRLLGTVSTKDELGDQGSCWPDRIDAGKRDPDRQNPKIDMDHTKQSFFRPLARPKIPDARQLSTRAEFSPLIHTYLAGIRVYAYSTPIYSGKEGNFLKLHSYNYTLPLLIKWRNRGVIFYLYTLYTLFPVIFGQNPRPGHTIDTDGELSDF